MVQAPMCLFCLRASGVSLKWSITINHNKLTIVSLDIGISANGAAGWGYTGEISSQRLRPYTSGFAASANSISGLIMSVLTPYMVNANKWDWKLKTGFFYAGVGLPWVIGTWLLVPETAR